MTSAFLEAAAALHPGLLIEGRLHPWAEFLPPGPGRQSAFLAAQEAADGPDGFRAELARFLEALFNDSPTVLVHTSGSTGKPKPFSAEKRRMAASARKTLAFLGVAPGERNLLAMPLGFIAGKMVVVRSILGGLDLVVRTPSRNPFLSIRDDEPIGLCAVTPMQAIAILDDPASAKRFLKSRRIIIGGGAVDDALLSALQAAEGEVYSSYGMTETLSHIALCRIAGGCAANRAGHVSESGSYRPLPGVLVSLSPQGTLVIDAPDVAAHPLITNDVAALLPDGGFRILGRLDNVINTGGIKVQTEVVEAKLARIIPFPFAVSARPSHTFGEEVVLLVEGDPALLDRSAIRAALGRYEKPRAVGRVDVIPRTATGKYDRPAIRALAARIPRKPGDLP